MKTKLITLISICFISSLSAIEITEVLHQESINQKVSSKTKLLNKTSDAGDDFYQNKEKVNKKVEDTITKVFTKETIVNQSILEDKVIITVDNASDKTKNIFLKKVTNDIVEDPTEGIKGNLKLSQLTLTYKNKEAGETTFELDSSDVKSINDVNSFYKKGLEKQDELLKENGLVTLKLKTFSETDRENGILIKEMKIVTTAKTEDGEIISTEVINLNRDGVEIVPIIKKEEVINDVNQTEKENNQTKTFKEGETFWNNPKIN